MMYIKEKEIRNTELYFKISPVYTTEDLVDRCRKFVDDYFTFYKTETYRKNYDFRIYSLSPIRTEYLVTAIRIDGLVYYKEPFHLDVYRNGEIFISIPDGVSEENKSVFAARMERGIQYAL